MVNHHVGSQKNTRGELIMGLDMAAIVNQLFAPIIAFLRSVLVWVLSVGLGSVIVFLVGFFVVNRVNPFRLTPNRLEGMRVRFKPYDMMRWLLWDYMTRRERARYFREYGFTLFVGRQGSGKTISMVQYLNEQKERYPRCQIVTNFGYEQADRRMESWRDLLEIRNGTDGVIFAIDEIHSEYSSASWKDFPESLLSEISQQRKQRIKIVSTSQAFSRVVKPIREQAFSVIACDTYLGRWTFNKEYDAAEYSTSDTPYQVKKKVKPIRRSSFVQSNYLRSCYDTFEKIKRMEKIEFLSRGERC